MPRAASETRATILDQAYRLFYHKGFSRVGVDEIAAGAGVTKRTLYYHFDSKDAVLAAMMEAQHALAMERARRWPIGETGSAADLVNFLFEDLKAWARRPDFTGPGFSRIVMELADLPGHPARAMARRHKAAIEAYVVELLERCGVTVADAPARGRELTLLMEGATVLMLTHGSTEHGEVARQAALKLIAG